MAKKNYLIKIGKNSLSIFIIISIIIAGISIHFFLGQNKINSNIDNNEFLESRSIEENNIIETRQSSPVTRYTREDIDKLGIDCSGTNEEIAECIYKWQRENMIYIPTAQESEGPFLQSYELRWQEILPGIYTSKDLIKNHVSSSGKPYGVCFGFSIVYCSVAEYYGLDCRIIQTPINVNNEARLSGMSQTEYGELKPWLDKAKLEYDYDAIRLTMPNDSEIAGHYWAEVKVSEPSEFNNDGWRIMDASNSKNEGRVKTKIYVREGSEWEIVDWASKDKTEILKEYQDRINAGEDIGRQNEEGNSDMDTFMEGRDIYADDIEAGRESVYIGITDELGNENRAKTIDDYMQGKALAPYKTSCRDSCDFIIGGNDCKNNCEKLDEEPAECYNDCAGEVFFIVCDYICEDASDSQWPGCYEACSGNKLNTKCDNSCYD